MFCEKCGAQISEDALFCKNCGSPTCQKGPNSKSETVASDKPEFLKKFFSNKKNILILAAVLLIAFFFGAVALIASSRPEKIYVDDCFKIVYTGVDGYADAHVEISYDKIKQLDKKLFPEGEYSLTEFISATLEIKEADCGRLKNGDKIKIWLNVGDLYKHLDGYKLVLRNNTVKVKGLEKVNALNLLDYVSLSYNGVSGAATLVVPNYEQSFKITDDIYCRFYQTFDELTVEIQNAEKKYLYNYTIYIDKWYNIANGDNITLSYSNVEPENDRFLKDNGVYFAPAREVITVSGLKESPMFDISKYVKAEFSGYSGFGVLSYTLPEGEFEFGDYRIVFSPSPYGTSSFVVNIIDKAEITLFSYMYYSEDFGDLKNGDNMKVYIVEELWKLYDACGFVIIDDFIIEVGGLIEPFTPDIVHQGNILFTGTSGFGNFKYELPESKKILKSPDGKYTVHFSLTETENAYYITAVFKDVDEKELFQIQYYVGRIDNDDIGYSNGDEIVFHGFITSKECYDILNQYGIYIKSEYRIKVEGLSQPIVPNAA